MHPSFEKVMSDLAIPKESEEDRQSSLLDDEALPTHEGTVCRLCKSSPVRGNLFQSMRVKSDTYCSTCAIDAS